MAEDLIEKIRHYKPEAQDKILEAINKRRDEAYRPFYCDRPSCDGFPHISADVPICHRPEGLDAEHLPPNHVWLPNTDEALGEVWRKGKNHEIWICPLCHTEGVVLGDGWGHPHARQDQHPPRWSADWLTWLVKSGRGAGKTFGGSNLVNRLSNKVPRLAIVGVTGPTMRRDMVEGPSGILSTAAPNNRPLWEPSKQELTWPNGAKGYCVSAEEPDRLRGLNSSFAWLDEPAHMAHIEEVWKMLLLGLRDPGFPTKILCTTTPLPSKWIRALMASPKTITTTVSTYANIYNLSSTFKDMVLADLEGTRLGKQEIHGAVIDEVEGALWTTAMFRYVEHPPIDMERIVVAVDPAGSVSARADETGIVVVGKKGREFFVLEDVTGRYSPLGWANKVLAMVEKWGADAVIAEKNYGGLMVKTNILQVDPHASVKLVDSRRGKIIRAEPVAGLYEQERVFHVQGKTEKLEDEQTTWVSGEGPSPNRIDAEVHGITELRKGVGTTQYSTPDKFSGAA